MIRASFIPWLYSRVINFFGGSSGDLQNLHVVLRRFPDWCGGHIRLSRIALKHQDFKLAYSSALAARKLGGGVQADILVAWSQLGVGNTAYFTSKDFVPAHISDKACGNPKFYAEVNELLAAVALQNGDLDTAGKAAEKIPERDRTPEIESLLRHRTKQMEQ